MSKHPKPDVHICACGETAWAFIDEKAGDKLWVAIVDAYNADLLASWRWRAYCPHRRISKDARKNVYYARRDSWSGGGPRTKLLHREVAGVTGRTVIVDHENHHGLDCRESNLRVGTHSQNRGNVRTAINNTSGYKGVSIHRGKWRAVVANQYLGLFDCKHDAARAYNAKAQEHFGAHALLNVIEGDAA